MVMRQELAEAQLARCGEPRRSWHATSWCVGNQDGEEARRGYLARQAIKRLLLFSSVRRVFLSDRLNGDCDSTVRCV